MCCLLLVVTVIFAALLFTYNWAMLIIGSIGYLALIPYSFMRYRTLAARDKASEKAAQTSGTDETPLPELDGKHTGSHTDRLQ